MKRGDELLIVEARGGTSTLGTTKAGEQLSQGWINAKISKLLRGTPEEVAWAGQLEAARDSGKLQVLLVSTPIDGDVVLDPVFKMKEFGEIGDTAFDPT